MKKYVKAQVIAKNLPTGSYAAGCPANYNERTVPACFIAWSAGEKRCSACERSK